MLHALPHVLADYIVFSFLAHACLRYIDERVPYRFDWVLGLNTLTSMNAFSNLPPQNPYIATSNRAWSSLLEEQRDKGSPESGCRLGSVVTAWQTSVNNMAIMSLTSLCLTAGNPPVLQVKACSTLNG